MIIRIITIFSLVAITGCSVSGKYRSDGPCEGFHQDPLACEQAYENAQAAPNVQIGQSTNEVRHIMGGTPATRQAASNHEEWSYLIDYNRQKSMVIIFENGSVIEIKQEGP